MIATLCQDKAREGDKKGHPQSLDPALVLPYGWMGEWEVEAGPLRMCVKAEKEVGSADHNFPVATA